MTNEEEHKNKPSTVTMSEPPQSARNRLEKNILRRRASLTEHEAAFLHALLVDEPPSEKKDVKEVHRSSTASPTDHMERAAKVLDDDILFSLPFDETPNKAPRRKTRSLSFSVGLWRAHQDGVSPSQLAKMHSMLTKSEKAPSEQTNGDNKLGESQSRATEDDKEQGERESDEVSIKSDEEVRVEKDEENNDSTASSWDLSEGGFDHYDAWEVLKDEYASDFGFDYGGRKRDTDYENPTGTFQILGTAANDLSAQPHVLSPPLMEALLSFVPESVSNDNFWLRFSLVRDGASLSTLKRYVRAAPNTILAIETTKGDVFGAFTTSPWTTHTRYFGSDGNTFLWRMRYNRLTPCHSLFEQAQMENEIDVYCYSGLNEYVQLCTNNRLAVGGGELEISGNEKAQGDLNFLVNIDEGRDFGFGLAVDDDLLQGTSSRCATFRSPCLVNHSSSGETFEVVNLEIWSFTPHMSIDEAERAEMTQFFIQETIRSSASSLSASPNPNFTAQDFNQQEFYRRVGERDDSELERDGWQYAMMMTQGTSTMHSPNIGH